MLSLEAVASYISASQVPAIGGFDFSEVFYSSSVCSSYDGFSKKAESLPQFLESFEIFLRLFLLSAAFNIS